MTPTIPGKSEALEEQRPEENDRDDETKKIHSADVGGNSNASGTAGSLQAAAGRRLAPSRLWQAAARSANFA